MLSIDLVTGGDWHTRLRRNNARAFELRMRSSRNSRMAVIVIERKRWVLRRCLHVLLLRGRRRDVVLVDGGKLLRPWRVRQCAYCGQPPPPNN